MPPIRTHDLVIDLSSSSPIPTPTKGSLPPRARVQTRAQSRSSTLGGKEEAGSGILGVNLTETDPSRSIKAKKASSNAKRKGRRAASNTLDPVIVLTDSEDEGHRKKRPGPSNAKKTIPSSPVVIVEEAVVGSSPLLRDKRRATNVNPDEDAELPNGLLRDVEEEIVPVVNNGKGKGKAKEPPVQNRITENRVSEERKNDKDDRIPEEDIPWPELDVGPLEDDDGEPIAGPAKQRAGGLQEAPAELDPVDAIDPLPDQDPSSLTLIRILEVTPDVDPEFLHPLIEAHLPNFGNDPVRTAEFLIGVIFERGSNVPRIKTKGKRKSEVDHDKAQGGDDRKGKKAKVDWGTVDRHFGGGANYIELALIHLQTSFPYIPKQYLRHQLFRHNSHYAPTHLAIQAAEKEFATAVNAGQDPKQAYEKKVAKYNPKRDLIKAQRGAWKDDVLEEERKWIVEQEDEENNRQDGVVGANDKGKGKGKATDIGPEEESDVAEGEGIECQCCFAEYSFGNMVQCPEAHLFCKTCVSQYASTQLGSHNASLLCMHSSDCKQPFPESELRRVLDTKLMDLYERVKQQKDIEAAGLENLEECPFCEWKCVIEASMQEEKLFRCGNEDGGCGVVSCRMCKKEDHLPKSCKEVTDDKHLTSQHVVEEAMTQALMRQCPKCKKPFIKESGCNKMSCPNCHTLSCYVCRQIIRGYDHFHQNNPSQPQQGGSKQTQKCLLWDSVDQRHADEVKAAAERALAEFKEANPDIGTDALKIDIPKAPSAPAVPIPGFPPYNAFNMNNNNAFNFAAMNAHQARLQQVHHPAMFGPAQQPVMPILPLPQLPFPVVPPPPRAVPKRRSNRTRGGKMEAAQAVPIHNHPPLPPVPAVVPPAPVPHRHHHHHHLHHALPPPPRYPPYQAPGVGHHAEEPNERERRERLYAEALRRHEAERPRALDVGMPGVVPPPYNNNAPPVGLVMNQDIGRPKRQRTRRK